MTTEHTAAPTVPLSYAIRLAQAFEKLQFTMDWLHCNQDDAIAHVSVEFSVQPEDVEACALAKAGAA